MRRTALARRAALDAAERLAAAQSLAHRAVNLPIPMQAAIAVYWPIRSELDLRTLTLALWRMGHPIGLPVVADDRVTMAFRRWQPYEPMLDAPFGLKVPQPANPEVDPDALLIPLAAFDRFGHRIGYGAGHYDRALARLEATRPRIKIGIAFSVQEVDIVPREAHDIRLDYVLTERGLMAAVPEPV